MQTCFQGIGRRFGSGINLQRVYDAVIAQSRTGAVGALNRLETEVVRTLKELPITQLSAFAFHFGKTKSGSPSFWQALGDRTLPSITELEARQMGNSLSQFFLNSHLFKYDWNLLASALSTAKLDGRGVAGLLYASLNVQTYPQLQNQLISRITDDMIKTMNSSSVAMTLYSLKKLNYPDRALFLTLITAYTRFLTDPQSNEYPMAMMGASDYLLENSDFVRKMNEKLGLSLKKMGSRMICNVCHAASKSPDIYTVENWERISLECISRQDLLANPYDLSTILHAFHKAGIDMMSWGRKITPELMSRCNTIQAAVISFSLRSVLPNLPQLKPILAQAVIAHMSEMSAKHKVNVLLMWSDYLLYDESIWTQMEPFLYVVERELKDTNKNDVALNQVCAIATRIHKYRVSPDRYSGSST